MSGIILTQSSTPIIGQVAWLLGILMDGIFKILDTLFNIENIGLSIIIFTIVIYTLMIPLTVKQQKFQKLSAVMNPEIQQIQKKYKGKKDQASQQKMMEETKLVYEKYGTSQVGGCLQLLIQMPILFGLYQVIQNIPAYVGSMKEVYMPLANEIMASPDYIEKLGTIGKESPILKDPEKFDYNQVNTVIDVLYKMQSDTWALLVEEFPSLSGLITTTIDGISHFNTFLGINIADSPFSIISDNWNTNIGIAIIALLIPLLSGLSQYISLKITSAKQGPMDPDNPMASSMKTMNTTMPILSVVMCFSFASGLGLYWIASAVVRTVQQVLISKYLDRTPIEEMIKKNQKIAAKKREKSGTTANKINEMAQKNAKRIEEIKASQMTEAEKAEVSKKAADRNSSAKPGSLAAKANMVKDYKENSTK